VTPLLGRQDELRWLEQAVDRHSRAVLVAEAGIGKTTLLEAYVARASSGATFVPCVASLRSLPYQPLRLALDMPLTGDVAAVALAVRGWLRGAALVVDDLDAADEHTLALLALLAGRIRLVVSLRAGLEADRVLAAAGLAHAPTRELGPLDDELLRELVRASTPRLTASQLEARVRAAGGNPLFVLEGSSDAASFAVSCRVRLRALPADARRSLLQLTLIGRAAPISWLAGGVDRLLAERLVVPAGDDHVAVRHALIGEHASALSKASERRLVRRELAGLVADPGEAARLLDAAGDSEAARSLAEQAASRATGAERAHHLALVARLSAGPERSTLVAEACHELLDSGDARGARALLDAAPDVVAAARRGEANGPELLLASALASWELGDSERSVRDATAGSALAEGSDSATEVRLLVLQAQPALWSWDPEAAAPTVERATELAARIGKAQVDALTLRAQLLYVEGRGASAREEAAVAHALATAGGGLREVLTAGLLYIVCLLQTDRISDAAEVGEELIARLRGAGREASALQVETLLLDFLVFRRPEAPLILRLQELLDEPLPLPIVEQSVANLAIVLARIGRQDEAARLLDQLETTTVNSTVLAFGARREIALADGRYDDVLQPGGGAPDGLVEESRAWAAFITGRSVEFARLPRASDMPVMLAPGQVIEVVERVQRGAASSDDVDRLLAAAATHEASGDPMAAARACWGAGELARRLAIPGASDLLLDAERRALELQLTPLLTQIDRSLRRLGITRRAGRTGNPTTITARQQEILDLVGAGYRSAQIAARLGISRSTVDRLVRNASRTLNARNRLHAAATQVAATRGQDASERRPGPVVVVALERAADVGLWQRRHRTWEEPAPTVLRLDDWRDEHVLLEAARGTKMAVVLSADLERSDRFLDDLRRLRAIERFHVDDSLSPRCVALAELLASGHTLERASDVLHVSLRTAEREVAKLRRALGARTTVEAVHLLLTRSGSRHSFEIARSEA
jgi:DNA-binding CsgD family transcriptional regulator